MFVSRLKRDIYSLYLILLFFKHYFSKHYAKCFMICAQTELLQSHISDFVSSFLFGFLKNKYDLKECRMDDPYIVHVRHRFSTESKLFIANDLLFLKPYISPKEKGVLHVKYTEILNAFPLLFDINKIEERYHLVLEQSSESPYQPFNGFYPTKSLVFVQSVSEREKVIHRAHGLIPVPLTSGDWVNRRNFGYDPTVPHVYDFCIVSTFQEYKRYPFLLAALKRYWKGDLKFAIVASTKLGFGRSYIDDLLKENGLTDHADIYLDIKPAEVSHILNQSHCHVLCSLREGSPKVNSESMITGRPVVIHKHHIGFPNWKFSPPLVINYTNAENLVEAIKSCAKIDKKEVADLAAKMIGSERATEVLNEEVKKAALAKGEEWTMDILHKVNNVHTFYYNPEDVNKCLKDYAYLEECAYDRSMYSAQVAIEMFSK